MAEDLPHTQETQMEKSNTDDTGPGFFSLCIAAHLRYFKDFGLTEDELNRQILNLRRINGTINYLIENEGFIDLPVEVVLPQISPNTLLEAYLSKNIEEEENSIVVNIPEEAINNLTPKEAELLNALTNTPGKLMTKEMLMDRLKINSSNTLNVLTKRLRDNLGEYKDHIEIIRGVGLRFIGKKTN